MNKKPRIAIGIIIILIAAGVFIVTSPTGNVVKEAGPVKIGLILPLTGNAADIGKSIRFSMELAAQEINQNGGINGRPIRLVIEDSVGCDAKVAVTAMQKLVNIDRAVAVYSVCSNVAIASHPVAEAGKVVHFGCASNPTIRELGDYIFRNIPSDEYAGVVGAQYVRDEFKAKRVAILYCDSDWCVGIKDVFRETFKSLGGEMVIEEQIKMGATDARTELTKIKSTNPDLVYFPGYPKETVAVFKQAKELGLDVPFFGGDAWHDQSIPKEAGDTAENKYYTTPAASYSKEFEEKVKGNIAICTVEAYDVIYILAETMKKVGVDSEAVKNELYNIKDYRGESGVIGFDEKGDLLTAAFDVMTYRDGKIVPYAAGVKSR